MTTTVTLADLAANSLNAVRILEHYGLDYCCGGAQPFDEACNAKGLRPEQLLREIDETGAAAAADRDWQSAPLHELVKHIVDTHHSYLKLDLPVLQMRIGKIVSVHGAKDAEMWHRLSTVFAGLRSELDSHLAKEEQILFPLIAQYGLAELQGRPTPAVPFGSIANPIAMMEREHSGAGHALAEMRALTNNFELPSYACSTVRALYEGMQTLEKDLHVHIHLENNILFARAIALERR